MCRVSLPFGGASRLSNETYSYGRDLHIWKETYTWANRPTQMKRDLHIWIEICIYVKRDVPLCKGQIEMPRSPFWIISTPLPSYTWWLSHQPGEYEFKKGCEASQSDPYLWIGKLWFNETRNAGRFCRSLLVNSHTNRGLFSMKRDLWKWLETYTCEKRPMNTGVKKELNMRKETCRYVKCHEPSCKETHPKNVLNRYATYFKRD